LTSPQRIADLVHAAQAGGFNTIFIQVRGRGEAFYRSDLDPRASELSSQPRDFDPLSTTLTLAHRAGLSVHAWVNVGLVSSAVSLPRSAQHVALRHPEWLMVPKPLVTALRSLDSASPSYVAQLAKWTRQANARVEGLYLSPVLSASRDYTAAVISELASHYPIDGVHLDYARYPGEEFDYSREALSEFRAMRLGVVSAATRTRLDELSRSMPAAWADENPDAWAAFRRDRLTLLVEQAREAARRARPGVIVSAAVGPDPESARTGKLQDWHAWADDGLLDAVCPMAYTADRNQFAEEAVKARTAAGSTLVWLGIGAWRLAPAATADYVRMARAAGANGVVLFSYDRLIEADRHYFDTLRPFLGFGQVGHSGLD
jgi:uncharacterized lipoprotein YddW (UPF0748 family)